MAGNAPGDDVKPTAYRVGERVNILLNGETWQEPGWVSGTIVRIDPYSAHRSFHWVELDEPISGMRLVSVLNPKKIQRLVDNPKKTLNIP